MRLQYLQLGMCAITFFMHLFPSLHMAYNLISSLGSRAKKSLERKKHRLKAEEFEAMASDGFDVKEEGVIVPIVPLKIIEPTDDRALMSASTPSAPPPPQPQVKTKRNKMILNPKSIPARETRSKTVKPSANTRSKSKI